jgi:hypothetical protein
LVAHAALLAVVALGIQPAGGASIDVPSYISELEHTAAAVRRAGTPEDASAAVPLRWTVRTDAGVITVDAAWIRQQFAGATAESWPSVRQRVAGGLDAMRLEADGANAGPGGDPAAILAATLATREFQRAQTSNWFEQLRARISEWILRLFTRFFGASMGSRTLAQAFAWIAGMIALTALAMWLARVLTRPAPATGLELEQLARRAPAREWALRAVTAARNGDLREAVRCGYHAAVLRLEEQGVWTTDEARTPREYMRLLGGDDARRATLGDLTRRFEQVRYGCRTATSDDARQVAVHLERLGCLHPGDQTI